MYNKITQIINELEEKHDIEILLACETSSHTWGYANANSDRDVSFIFKRRSIDYYIGFGNYETVLHHKENVDGIEINLTGWDIKKALHLARKSNSTLTEMVGVAYTQQDYVYKDNFTLKHFLSEFQLKHFCIYTLARSYSSTMFHHVYYDYERFTDNPKKQLKSLIAGFRMHRLIDDFLDNGMTTSLLNYSKGFVRIGAYIYDKDNGTNFSELLEIRKNDIELSLDQYNSMVQSRSKMIELDKVLKERTDNLKRDITDTQRFEIMTKIVNEFLCQEVKK